MSSAPTFGMGYMEVDPATTPEHPKPRAVDDALTAINDPNFTDAFYSEVYKSFPIDWPGNVPVIYALFNLCKAYAAMALTPIAVTNLPVTLAADGNGPIVGYPGAAIQQSSVVVKDSGNTITYAVNTDYTLQLNGDTLLIVRVPTGAIPAEAALSVSFSYFPVP